MKINSRILFQGDSITDSGRVQGEDNTTNNLGNGYVSLIAAKIKDSYPMTNYDIINRGISGNRIVDLYTRWNEDAVDLKPDVISILIGVNDVYHDLVWNKGVSAEKFQIIYDKLINETIKLLPECRIIICEPFLLPVGTIKDNRTAFYNEILKRQKTTREIASNYGLLFVPLQEGFNNAADRSDPAQWLFDGIHPTTAGHELICENWMQIAGEIITDGY